MVTTDTIVIDKVKDKMPEDEKLYDLTYNAIILQLSVPGMLQIYMYSLFSFVIGLDFGFFPDEL